MAGYSLLFGLEDNGPLPAGSQTLTSPLTPGAVAPGAVRKLGLRAIAFLRGIWAKSLSADFRTSGFSRRTAWHISLPILCVYNIISDLVVHMPLSIVSGDVLQVCAFVLATWRLPVQSWWCDVIMVAAVVSCFVWSQALINAGVVYTLTTPGVQALLFLACAHLCGVNTFAVFAGVLLCVLATAWMDPGEVVWIAVTSLALVPWTVLLDSAGVMAHLARAAVQKLLDDCNDGFFSVNLGTGRVSSASDKMGELFSLQSDCDRPFADSVVADDSPRFARLLGEAMRGNFEPTFLSCRTASTEFDCKLVPYFACMDHLYLCVQVIGEVRMGLAPCPEGSHAGGDPPRNALATGAGEGGRAEQRLAARAPANDADDGNTEISFDLTSVAAPTPGERAHYARSLLSYSASSAPTGPRHQVRAPAPQAPSADAATQTFGHPPLRPGARQLEAGGACAGRTPSSKGARRARVHVQLCSSRRVLPQFAATPVDNLRVLLSETLFRVNTTGSGCCAFHIVAARLRSVLHGAPCQPKFRPHDAWQCAQCFFMNSREDCDEDGRLTCGLCYAGEPIFPGAAPGDPASDAGSGSGSGASASAAGAASSTEEPMFPGAAPGDPASDAGSGSGSGAWASAAGTASSTEEPTFPGEPPGSGHDAGAPAADDSGGTSART